MMHKQEDVLQGMRRNPSPYLNIGRDSSGILSQFWAPHFQDDVKSAERNPEKCNENEG